MLHLTTLPLEILYMITENLMTSYAIETDFSIFDVARVDHSLQDAVVGIFFKGDSRQRDTTSELMKRLQRIEVIHMELRAQADLRACRRRSVSLPKSMP